jgi:hypothetical protein
MPFHELANWDATRVGLHQAAQVLNAIKVPSVERQPNARHHSLTPDGASLRTGKLNFGGELRLDLLAPEGAAIIYAGDKTGFVVPIHGQTQQSLLQTVLAELAKLGHSVTPRMDSIEFDEPIHLDNHLVGEYAITLESIYVEMARFRGRLAGMMSPIVLWPHHFDMAFLYFLAGQDEHSDPHINFGFSPESPGFPRPYFYVYRYPMPDGLLGAPLPEVAYWHNSGWTGVVIEYDAFIKTFNHERRLAYWLHDIYEILSRT